jgi:hypothetical protein
LAFGTLSNDAIALAITYLTVIAPALETQMVSRIRKTLTVQQRTAMLEQTNKAALEVTQEATRKRQEKTAKLRALRLAAVARGRTS